MQKIEQTLTSLEVAELMERPHKKLLETIRLYVSYMEQLEKEKQTSPEEGRLKYFIDSSYIAGNGQEQPCYKITKIGCEFLAHKMKGIKGTDFTMRYIDRFHKMEESLSTPKLPKNPMEVLELHYQAIKQVDGKAEKALTGVDVLTERVDRIELDLPLLPIEADEIVKAVKKKGVEVMGTKQSPAYKDRGLRQKVYNDIYSNLKHNFGGIKSYKAIRRRDAGKAVQVVNGYRPPLFLEEQIEQENAQITMDTVS